MMTKVRIIVMGVFILISIGQNLFSQSLTLYTTSVGDSSDFENIWISLNGGCSLGCAIGWRLSTTSALPNKDSITYKTENMNDGDSSTAWIEGKNDYGIGEKIIIKFDSGAATHQIPFDGIQLTNGYSKSRTIWENNSRVKLFKIYLNGKPQFLLKLHDSFFPQRINWGRNFLISEGDIVELEIMDVFKGKKWKDTAISDLSLMGAH